jgi:hypothetical protein
MVNSSRPFVTVIFGVHGTEGIEPRRTALTWEYQLPMRTAPR